MKTKRATKPQELQITDQLITNYFIYGRIDYEAAFRDHPEWKTLLGADTRNGFNALKARIMNRRRKQQAQTQSQTRKRAQARKKAARKLQHQAPRITHTCTVCGTTTVQVAEGITMQIDGRKVDVATAYQFIREEYEKEQQ